MSALPINTPIREYMTRGGEPVTLAEAETILAEIEDVAGGIDLFCKARLQDLHRLTSEETATLTFINLGVKRILSGLCRTIPEVQGGNHE